MTSNPPTKKEPENLSFFEKTATNNFETIKNSNHATNLLQIKGFKNLYQRNGIFYYRKYVDKKSRWLSLHTQDFNLAKVIYTKLQQGRAAHDDNIWNFFYRDLPNYMHNTNIMETNGENMGRKTLGHTFTEIKAGFEWSDRNNDRFPIMVDLLKRHDITSVEKLAQNPRILYKIVQDLEEYIIPQGGHKGEHLGKETAKAYFDTVKYVMTEAYEKNFVTTSQRDTLLNDFSGVYKKITASKVFSEPSTRKALSDNDFKILFSTCYKMKRGDFSEIDNKIKELDEKIKNIPGKTNEKERKQLRNYKNDLCAFKATFEQYYFIILMILWSGSREMAIGSIQTQDIDLKEHIFNITVNEEKKNNGDLAEKLKKLKTPQSQRKIPIAQILLELGIEEFVTKQMQKHGENAPLFKEAIAPRTNKGKNYRAHNIGERLNAFYKMLGFKDIKKGSLKDVHSLKTSFITHNKRKSSGLGNSELGAISGNKEGGSVLNTNYDKLDYDTAPEEMRDNVNKITFPHVEELFGGILPPKLKHLSNNNRTVTQSKNIQPTNHIRIPSNQSMTNEQYEEEFKETTINFDNPSFTSTAPFVAIYQLSKRLGIPEINLTRIVNARIQNFGSTISAQVHYLSKLKCIPPTTELENMEDLSQYM